MKLFEIISLNVLWSSRREKKKNIWGRVAGIGLNLVVKTIVKKNNFDIIEKKKNLHSNGIPILLHSSVA
jgi:hypothetical protein